MLKYLVWVGGLGYGVWGRLVHCMQLLFDLQFERGRAVKTMMFVGLQSTEQL